MVFLILSIIVFVFVVLKAPKRLPKSELYAIALFSVVLGYSTDIILDVKYNLYGYFSHGVQFAGLLPILFLFPASGVLFMNFYPFRKPLMVQLFYFFCWTVFCLVYEYFSVMLGFFYHHGWKYWYSAIVYPLLLIIQLLHYRFIKKFIE